MSMFEDVAAPHNTDPNSKMAKKLRNTHWRERKKIGQFFFCRWEATILS
jgi:hypothetical protein